MARLERKERADGGSSYMVRWRLGGTRTGSRQPDTLGAGSDSRTGPGPRAS
jgi:hypothetical protein